MNDRKTNSTRTDQKAITTTGNYRGEANRSLILVFIVNIGIKHKLHKEIVLVRPSPNIVRGEGGIDRNNAHGFYNHVYRGKKGQYGTNYSPNNSRLTKKNLKTYWILNGKNPKKKSQRENKEQNAR